MDSALHSSAVTAPHFSRFPTTPTSDRVGTSFKHEHFAEIMQEKHASALFFEVHAENYMGQGGLPHHMLTTIRHDHPISLHGVCMSIGGQQPLDKQHISRFRNLIERYQPDLVSEHLAWSTHGTTYYNDLLPLPYTRATLDRVCAHVDELQTAIKRPVLIENPATYVRFQESTMSESDFLRDLSRRTGCGLLLDINNVFVSATNHGFSATSYLAQFPLDRVGEVHLAGHSQELDADHRPILIDSHDETVCAPVWQLFASVIERCGQLPTLIEWDSKLPPWATLKAQAGIAREIIVQNSRPRRVAELSDAL